MSAITEDPIAESSTWMPQTLETRILAVVRQPGYAALKPKSLARKLKLPADEYDDFVRALKSLRDRGDVFIDKTKLVRGGRQSGEIVGTFKKQRAGGVVRIKPGQGKAPSEVYVRSTHAMTAATGDLVRVALDRRQRSGDRQASGRIVEIVERGASQFVGTLIEKDRETFVILDANPLGEPIFVSEPGAKNAKPGDKVVVEMVRYPSHQRFGEAAVTEVLGAAGAPGVDLLSVIKQFELPDEFGPAVEAEARTVAAAYRHDSVPADRGDLTADFILTIDPADAKDFDDAVSLTREGDGRWRLGVHIADVAHFVAVGGMLDRDARTRGTSVYLPGQVLPMLPEVISNGLASLQQGKIRLTKSVFATFDAQGKILKTEFANSAIRVGRRFSYGEVQAFFEATDRGEEDANIDGVAAETLLAMRELAVVLRKRRRKKGMLELEMPEAVLDYDADGKVAGCHYSRQSESQRLIEEFMLTANEAVAKKLDQLGAAFLRRVHPHPDPRKLDLFGKFAKSLGLTLEDPQDRFELQRFVRQTTGDPRQQAIHYALLRSMKEAVYAPAAEGHYALASSHYCHFTSPIRRYPDLLVHRTLDRWIRTGAATGDAVELVALGAHCSFTERRAAKAERELVKSKLMEYMKERVGERVTMTVTGVEEFGLFCQGVEIPAEGLLHVRRLPGERYRLERESQSLVGERTGRSFRLGDRLVCTIVRVDVPARSLDLELAQDAAPTPNSAKRGRIPERTSERKSERKPARKPKPKIAKSKKRRKR